jgi:hypothetical protein
MADAQTLIGTVVIIRRTVDDEQFVGAAGAKRKVTGEIVAHFDEAATGIHTLSLQVNGERHLAAYHLGQTVRLIVEAGGARPTDPPSPYTRPNSDLESRSRRRGCATPAARVAAVRSRHRLRACYRSPRVGSGRF